nr:methyltransferase domain-containing protein [Streptomyces boncukensis]
MVVGDGPSREERWLRVAYANRTWVTSIDGQHADHAPDDARTAGRPTSSSTLPGLVVAMFRHARIAPGMEVLDLATGSGYSAALLCHRLGDQHVTTVDVDPYLTQAAAARLADAGHRPDVHTVDATARLPGTWDRIVAMVSVSAVPAAWLAALRPGGRMVFTITGTGMVIGADRTDDGGAVGRVEPYHAGFMGVRHDGTGTYPPGLIEQMPQALTGEGEQVTTGRYPVFDPDCAWELNTQLYLAYGPTDYRYTEEGGRRVLVLVRPDGSWARAEEDDDQPGPTVHQSGPRRLWDGVERLRHFYNTRGYWGPPTLPVRIDPDGTCRITWGPREVVIPQATDYPTN